MFLAFKNHITNCTSQITGFLHSSLMTIVNGGKNYDTSSLSNTEDDWPSEEAYYQFLLS
jgi:hypothetical protein